DALVSAWMDAIGDGDKLFGEEEQGCLRLPMLALPCLWLDKVASSGDDLLKECDMPWKIGFRVLLEPLFAYGGVALMVSCVLGRAFLMLFLTDGGGFLNSLVLTILPSVACNLATLTLFGRVPSPVAHTSFVSASFGVLVQRIFRVLLYRKPKKGFRPVGVVLQFFSLGVVLFSMSVVLAVITADMFLAVEAKIPSVPAKATFAAIIFGNEVTRS
ncbi:hypothetical protein FOZ63_010119, partial [Perkinsus olseni]